MVGVFGAILFLGAIGATLLAVRFLSKDKEADASPVPVAKTPAPEKAPASAEPAAEEPAPAKSGQNPLVRQAESLPGKLIEQAQNAINTREQNGQMAGIEEALNGGPTPSQRTPQSRPAKPAASTGAQAATPAGATQNPAPDAIEPPAEPAEPVRPNPSTTFRAFVVNMRVNGVFQGQPGRAFINGKMYHEGEMIDPKLGIRFQRLDYTTKTLYFEDKTGALMPRRY